MSKDDQTLVEILAGILRIAIRLDRRHAGSVRSVRAIVDGDRLVIEPLPTTPNADLDLEIYAARERADLLGRALDIDVRVEQPNATDATTLSS